MIINFSKYLIESLDVEKLKHLEHAEDHIIHGGHEGVAHASDTMTDVADFLSGKPTKTRITTKWDGAPSIVFGINPENGKFFVATKSAFNKDPKLNYTAADIERNHGHAPGLVEKLKAALAELPKIMPKKGGVYQGDMMYTKDDVQDEGDKLSFLPNTITYKADKNSAEGRKAAGSKIGVVVHTQYKGKHLNDMKASFDVNQNDFQQDPDVNMISPELKAGQISGMEKKQFEAKMKEATQIYAGMDHDVFNVVDGHDLTMKTYINTCVRDNTVPDLKGYRKFVEARGKKEIDKVKSDAAKQKKKEQLDVTLSHIDNHKDQFEKLFKLHRTIQEAKNTLVGALSRSNTGYQTYIGGKEAKPEGFVAIRNGRPSKLVDRAEFSAANFAQGSFQKSKEEEVPKEEKPKAKVFTFGRMNPPTMGHRAVADRVQQVAKDIGAEHEIVLSHSQDPEKNPLSPEQKLKHAKNVLGKTAKISVADQSMPTVMDHVKRFAKEGVKHLVMVVGSDRVEEMKKLLDKYNGKEYNFDKIEVVSAGQRDPDAEDETAAISGTKMRAHALNNKFRDFSKGLPKDVSPADAQDMFNDVRKGMDIKIDANTNARALARYAMRNDMIGIRAKKEQERRAREKEMAKKIKKPAVKKVAATPLVNRIVAKRVKPNG